MEQVEKKHTQTPAGIFVVSPTGRRIAKDCDRRSAGIPDEKTNDRKAGRSHFTQSRRGMT
jgi:hypothetical protein